jgi:hypothetical protein
MTNPHVGKLMQLQLVWVSTSCEEAVSGDISSSSSSSDSKGGSAKEQKSKQGMQASLFSIGSSSSGGGHSEEGAEADISSNGSSSGGSQGVGKCKGNQLCSSDGRCVTSSCSMNGLGADVPNMVCSGTTMRLPFLSAGVAVSPCTFLGCRLDVGSCTSTGLMGVGGFCTGRVVATGTAELLHPQGRQWLGYPCVEHRPAPSIIAGVLGNEQQQQQTFASSGLVAKAWKVCDCVRTATMRSSLAILMPNGTITSFRFGRPADSTGRGGSLKGGSPSNKQQQKDTNKQQQAVVAVPLMPVYDMELKDVMTQWLAAKAGNAALPSTSISADLAEDLQELLPGFTTPSLIIANTSAPLMARPEWLAKGALVFVLPNAALPPLRGLLPDLTSLPTLALPPNMTSAQAEAALKVPKAPLQVADLTIASLPSVASKLGLPLFLQLTPSTNTTRLDLKSDIGPHLVPLEHMHIGNAVVQWATAVSRKEPLPKLVLNNKTQLAQLQAKVPGLVTPSIIVPNISHALLYKPTNASLPLFELPGKTTADAVALLPEMTSLPSFLVLKEQEKQVGLW